MEPIEIIVIIACILIVGGVIGKINDKWIGDIAKAVFNASKYTLKGNKRLSADVYADRVFDSVFGDEKQDMMYHLDDFRDDYPEFADFEIDDDMVDNLFNIVSELRVLIPNMIAEHKGSDGLHIPHTKSIIRPIIRKYISFDVGKDNWYK